MSFVGSMFSNAQGAGFQGQNANLVDPVTQAQINQAYQNTQSGLSQQQDFVNALAAQNGIQNQSNVYGQLQNVASGQGPNPAQAMLNQATGQNVANQAALMGSQRGAGQNVGLIARQAAQQGAAQQQAAVGQGATLQAQQSLGALSQLGGLASQQVAQQQGGLGQYNQLAQGEQSNLLGAQGQFNQTQAGMQANLNTVNAGLAAGNQAFQQKAFAAPFNAAGTGAFTSASPAAPPEGAHGGMIDYYAQGGQVGPQSYIGQMFNQPQQFAHGGMAHNMKRGGKVPGEAEVAGDSYTNDTIPAVLSPKEIVLPRSITLSENAPEKAKEFVRQTLAKRYAEGGDVGPQPASDIQGPPPPPTDSFSLPFLQAGKNTLASLFGNQGSTAPTAIPGAGESPQATLTTPVQETPKKPIFENYHPEEPKAENQNVLNQLPGKELYEEPVRKIGEAAAAEAEAKGQAGQQQAAALGQGSNQLQNSLNHFQNNVIGLDQDVKNTVKDVNNGQINSNHWYESLSTAGKIQTSIGLILGGIGGTLSGQENPALKFMQNQIDRDIESQRTNLASKQNLVAANLKRFGNMQDAMAMSKATMLAITSQKVEKAMALAQTPIEKQRAQQLLSQLQLQYGQQINEIGIRQTLLGQSGQNQQNQTAGIDPALAVRFLAPKGQEHELHKELQSYEEMNKAKENLLNNFDKAAAENTAFNRFTSPIQTKAKVNAWLEPAIAKLSKDSAGKFTEADATALKHLVDTKYTTSSTQAELRKALDQFVTEKMNFPGLRSIGVNPSTAVGKRNVNAPQNYQTAKR